MPAKRFVGQGVGRSTRRRQARIAVCLFLLAGLAQSSPARPALASLPGPTGGPITVGESLGGSNPSEPNLEASRGCPCHSLDMGSGSFFDVFTDLQASNPGLPVDLARTYNSMDSGTDGPFGHGWSPSFGSSLFDDGAGHATITQENGSQVTFTLSAGTYSAPPRVVGTLVHSGGSYTFVRRHHQTFSYDSAGRLTQETDLNGNTLTYAHDA